MGEVNVIILGVIYSNQCVVVVAAAKPQLSVSLIIIIMCHRGKNSVSNFINRDIICCAAGLIIKSNRSDILKCDRKKSSTPVSAPGDTRCLHGGKIFHLSFPFFFVSFTCGNG